MRHYLHRFTIHERIVDERRTTMSNLTTRLSWEPVGARSFPTRAEAEAYYAKQLAGGGDRFAIRKLNTRSRRIERFA